MPARTGERDGPVEFGKRLVLEAKTVIEDPEVRPRVDERFLLRENRPILMKGLVLFMVLFVEEPQERAGRNVMGVELDYP